ncbi:Retrovirus-related Pol polyprotein from transposon TNT 1-94 [Cucumis melo var. makuwa]|uniref:Retrovirus-related Pol polyprotein from transposon TNT 1-94 n=1 Tax=Cucumis melo var. makuwa TaxID=1194695 RepID=A0A5A7U7W6_CUCMM|nr:Retrovirus-related Pol polyprotein from transposon TNT 1-94 [Cucumis melo var. makuwa]TYK12177.1 Retrovirus-related Pol polyprotein from transposon TNT 1-94 [Cucumis melo var. makuwa]
MELMTDTKFFLSSHFEMKDLGEADVILGVKIRKNKTSLSLCQSHYVEKILKKFDFFDVSPVRTPFDASKHLMKNKGDSVSQPEYAKIIGSVMYLMNYTRPDIAYAVSRLSRYTHNPDRYHWDVLRHLLRYLKGTIDYCLYFNKFPAVLEGYCDANWVTDNDEVNSTSGYVFLLGGGAISWKSTKQTCIARSTMESEFIALELAGQEAEWIKNLLGDVPLWGTYVPVSIQCDSQAAICTAKNSVYNGKSRHIRLKHAVVKQLLKKGTISFKFVRSEKNLADPLTKGLTRKMVLDSSMNMGLKPFGDP